MFSDNILCICRQCYDWDTKNAFFLGVTNAWRSYARVHCKWLHWIVLIRTALATFAWEKHNEDHYSQEVLADSEWMECMMCARVWDCALNFVLMLTRPSGRAVSREQLWAPTSRCINYSAQVTFLDFPQLPVFSHHLVLTSRGGNEADSYKRHKLGTRIN